VRWKSWRRRLQYLKTGVIRRYCQAASELSRGACWEMMVSQTVFEVTSFPDSPTTQSLNDSPGQLITRVTSRVGALCSSRLLKNYS
jgi:hypothetical protein